jgi:hypothetical protein
MTGPKRGIDLYGTALVEYDMRCKTTCGDLQLIDGISAIDDLWGTWNRAFTKRIYGDCGSVQAPPKCKLFAWLIIQNRVWTADRLQKRGWPSCVLCKLCNQVQESADHLLYKCRFTTRIWIELKEWLGLHDVDPRAWHNRRTVKEWWTKSILQRGQSRKAMASLAMLVSWEIWKERNARVFQNSATTSFMLIAKVKDEMAMWCHAGAKALCILMPRE